MIEKFVKLGVALPPFILLIGIVAARLTGSPNALEFTPFISVIRGGFEVLVKSAKEAPLEGSPGKDENIVELGKEAASALAKAPNPLAEIPSDPRLAVCSKGALAHGDELPFTLADSYKTSSANPKDLMEVQSKLGAPNCVESRGKVKEYRYLVAGGRFITAAQDGDKPKVELYWGNW